MMRKGQQRKKKKRQKQGIRRVWEKMRVAVSNKSWNVGTGQKVTLKLKKSALLRHPCKLCNHKVHHHVLHEHSQKDYGPVFTRCIVGTSVRCEIIKIYQRCPCTHVHSQKENGPVWWKSAF